jgi:SagB-type dehydrogenase family enzyme
MTDNCDEALWELFHENSKLSWSDRHPTFKLRPNDAAVIRMMRQLHAVHPYTDFPKVALPECLPPATRNLDEVLRERVTARAFSGAGVRLDQLGKVLAMSYGITQASEGTPYPRDLRIIPSGGALYPLELYVYAARVDGLEAALYHYNPERHNLDLLRAGDALARIAEFFIQPQLAAASAVILFITAFFARSVFKYGDRGYRFILLEAGHLAQNANLTAQEMGLATANIGGFLDRDVDRYLGLDGVNQSTIYVLFLGHLGSGRVPAPDRTGETTAANN